MAAKKLKVTQLRSGIGRVYKQRQVLRGLGLKGPNSEVFVDDTSSFRGMIKKVLHLVTVEEVSAPAKPEVKKPATTAKPATAKKPAATAKPATAKTPAATAKPATAPRPAPAKKTPPPPPKPARATKKDPTDG